jgi:hypothetical protein
VLVIIIGREIIQYPPSMKSGANMKNLNKFFYCDHGYENEECHALKKR